MVRASGLEANRWAGMANALASGIWLPSSHDEQVMLTARMLMNAPRLQSLLTIATLLGCASPIAAQTPIVPTALKTADGKEKVTITYPKSTSGAIADPGEHPVAALTRVYNTGNGQQLNTLAIEILSTLSCLPEFFSLPTGTPCVTSKSRKAFDFKRDYVLVTWVGLDFSGKRVVYRIGVHDERTPDPYNVTLPGLGRSQTLDSKKSLPPEKPALYEVFLSVTGDSDHASLYVFTAQPDALEAQIPALVAAATGPMFASAAKLFGNVNKVGLSIAALTAIGGEVETSEEPPPVSVKVSTLIPPLASAKAKVTDVVVQPFPYVDFQRQVRDLAGRLVFVEATRSQCASEYVSLLAPQLAEIAKSADCTGAASTPSICRTAFSGAFERTYSAVDTTCAQHVKSDVETANAGRADRDKWTPAQVKTEIDDRLKVQRSAMQQVDTEFRKLVAAQQPERLTADSSLTNTPLTHWSFGVLTAFSFGETVSATRVKVGGDGKLAPDPLSRQLTAFVVNVAPAGYRADAPTMSWAERVRGFIGVTTTPEFGVAAGVSVQIWKGVGVNFGGARMVIPTFGDANDRLGQAPSEPSAPFGTAHANAVFVGAHYTFTGK